MSSEEERRLLQAYQATVRDRLTGGVRQLTDIIESTQRTADMIADDAVNRIQGFAEDRVESGLSDTEEAALDNYYTIWDALDRSREEAYSYIPIPQADASSLIGDAVNNLKAWVLDRLSDADIELDGALGDFGYLVADSIDALGVDFGSLVNDIRLDVETGLEDAEVLYVSSFGALKGEVTGILDAVGEAFDPLVTGLNLGFLALITEIKDALDIDVDSILDAQEIMQRKTMERRIRELKPIEEPTE